jgi:hypothetical protein
MGRMPEENTCQLAKKCWERLFFFCTALDWATPQHLIEKEEEKKRSDYIIEDVLSEVNSGRHI